jgi:toxin CptA
MHNAPSVSYRVGRSRFAAALLLLGWLLGALVTVMWALQPQLLGWRIWMAWVLLVIAGVLAAWNWWRSPRGALAWDGERWSWPGQAGVKDATLDVVLDLQRCILLRCTWRNGSQWLWLERTGASGSWDDLRRAVYSRASPEALPPVRPPAAKP